MANGTPQFVDAIKRIESNEMDLVSLITIADSLIEAEDGELSQTLYRFWLLSNPEHPLRHVIAFNCGSRELQSGNIEAAKRYLSLALVANPEFFQAQLNLATAFERGGDNAGAIAEWQKIIDRLPTLTAANIGLKIQAFKNIARVNKSAAAVEALLKQAVELDPSQPELLQHWFNRRQGRCVWPALEAVGSLSVRDVVQRLAPLSISSLIDDPRLHLLAAINYSRQMAGSVAGYGVVGVWPPPPARDAIQKIRVGYLSSDFCHHAVGYLMSDVFENHDRTRYEISVFNIGERNNDAIQQRIMGQVDRWVDLRGIPDRAAAKIVTDQGIHILIDMNGHTNYQRTGLLALRPAPIIVNWLGYPGTMGSEYHNYIIADDFIIPPQFEKHYSEQVLRLPCYQPNGKLYPVPEVKGGRADFGLPERGVVFCCFNGSVKFTEPVFHRWCVILAHVPGSVIWMRGSDDQEHAIRLRAEAARRGIAPERLVFLPFRSNTEYLGCHRLADLFLDTFPYGAHTTASDALRMGVPIVTLAGMSFASRVAGSLSRAAGLTDLVCENPDQYVVRAIDLGNNPEKLRAIKGKLQSSLPGCDLFNAPKLVGRLEALFEQMWRDWESGSLPRPGLRDVTEANCVPIDPRWLGTDFYPFHDYEHRLQLAGVA